MTFFLTWSASLPSFRFLSKKHTMTSIKILAIVLLIAIIMVVQCHAHSVHKWWKLSIRRFWIIRCRWLYIYERNLIKSMAVTSDSETEVFGCLLSLRYHNRLSKETLSSDAGNMRKKLKICSYRDKPNIWITQWYQSLIFHVFADPWVDFYCVYRIKDSIRMTLWLQLFSYPVIVHHTTNFNSLPRMHWSTLTQSWLFEFPACVVFIDSVITSESWHSVEQISWIELCFRISTYYESIDRIVMFVFAEVKKVFGQNLHRNVPSDISSSIILSPATILLIAITLFE